ncbi:MAG: sporulation protein YqfD, partial [Bacteroidota bacterium]
MSFYRFWSRLGGTLVLLVEGNELERFLNLASANGIYLWNVRRLRPDFLTAHVGLRGFRALRPHARRTQTRIMIRRRLGWPFVWRRFTRRPGFVLGFVLAVAALFFLTGFVWRVEISGLRRIPAHILRRDLRRFGLYEGARRGKIDKERIRRQLELSTPDASWIGIEIRGMVAFVRVVERMVPPAQRTGGDLVASRDGLLTKVVAYRGTPVVAEGETVHAGQLLVSGIEVGLGPDGTLRPQRVPASARVEARVWDEARSLTPLAFWTMVPTGRRARAVCLRLGPWTVVLGPRRPPFAWYKMQRTRRGLWHGRNTLALVELI